MITTIHKQILVDESGKPKAVQIPWDEFCQIEETLGLDLEPEVVKHLEQIRRKKVDSDYVSLEDL